MASGLPQTWLTLVASSDRACFGHSGVPCSFPSWAQRAGSEGSCSGAFPLDHVPLVVPQIMPHPSVSSPSQALNWSSLKEL